MYGVLHLPLTKKMVPTRLEGIWLLTFLNPQSRMTLSHTRIATHRNHEDPGCSGFSEKAFDRLCAETLGDQRRQRCLLHFWKVSLKSSPQIFRKIHCDHHFSFLLAKMVVPRFGMEQDQLRSIMQVSLPYNRVFSHNLSM